MFEKLKRKYINWQIKSLASQKKYKREKQFLNWEDVTSVIVLVAYDMPNNAEIDTILDKLSGKDVSVFCYLSQSNFVRQDSDQVTYFNPKSVSMLSKPNKIMAGKFMKNDSDILIDLTLKESLPLKFLAGTSTAYCRCGMKKEGYSLYDLEISSSQKLSKVDLLDQILFYLNTIKSKK